MSACPSCWTLQVLLVHVQCAQQGVWAGLIFHLVQVCTCWKPITFPKDVSPFPLGMVAPWQICMFSPFLSEWVCSLYISCCLGFYPLVQINSSSGGKADGFPVWLVVCKSIPNNAFFHCQRLTLQITSVCFWTLYKQKQRIYYFVTYASHTVTYTSILLFFFCIVFCCMETAHTISSLFSQ